MRPVEILDEFAAPHEPLELDRFPEPEARRLRLQSLLVRAVADYDETRVGNLSQHDPHRPHNDLDALVLAEPAEMHDRGTLETLQPEVPVSGMIEAAQYDIHPSRIHPPPNDIFLRAGAYDDEAVPLEYKGYESLHHIDVGCYQRVGLPERGRTEQMRYHRDDRRIGIKGHEEWKLVDILDDDIVLVVLHMASREDRQGEIGVEPMSAPEYPDAVDLRLRTPPLESGADLRRPMPPADEMGEYLVEVDLRPTRLRIPYIPPVDRENPHSVIPSSQGYRRRASCRESTVSSGDASGNVRNACGKR